MHGFHWSGRVLSQRISWRYSLQRTDEGLKVAAPERFPVVLCVSVDVEQSSRDGEWAADFCRCVRERKRGWNQEQTKKQGQSQTKSQEETRTLRYYGLNEVALTVGATARRLSRVFEEVLIVKMRCSWWILTDSSTPADNHPCLCYVEFLSSAILW